MKKFMERELKIIGREDLINKLNPIVDIINKQGHSGFSMSILIGRLINNINEPSMVVEIEDESKQDYDKMMNKDVVEVDNEIRKQELTDDEIVMLKKLLKYQPLSLLTYNDNEWNTIDSTLKQNKRNPSVFMEADKRPYLSGGIYFIDLNGATYTGHAKLPDSTTLYSKCYIKDYNKELVRFGLNVNENDVVLESELNKIEQIKELYDIVIK